MCYTYDSLNRVIKRQVISLDCDCVVSEENYNCDAAGNITEEDKRTVPLSPNHQGKVTEMIYIWKFVRNNLCLLGSKTAIILYDVLFIP